MSHTDSCREYHLTPEGWVMGSFHGGLMDGEEIAATPFNRVLTIGITTHQSSHFSSATHGESELWRCNDAIQIAELTAKFGKSPKDRAQKKTPQPALCEAGA